MKVVPIRNSVLQSCSFLLYKEEEQDAILIDCGDVQPILDELNNRGLRLVGIFITHCHYDHVYGLNDLLRSINFQCKVYVTEICMIGLKDIRVNLSKYHKDPFVLDEDVQTILIASNCLQRIAGIEINCIPTPGHDSSCICYLIEKCLFTGDSYIPHLPVFTKWKRSNKDQALKYEEKLRIMSQQNGYRVYFGHWG